MTRAATCHISPPSRVSEDMTTRMSNPAGILPEAVAGIRSLIEAAEGSGLPRATMDLVHLRASQINGCSPCVYAGAISAKKAGESDERLFAVAAWRETGLFSDAERAALALAESMTRLADRPDPVPEAVWNEAAAHFEENSLPASSSGWRRRTCSTGSMPPASKWRAPPGRRRSRAAGVPTASETTRSLNDEDNDLQAARWSV